MFFLPLPRCESHSTARLSPETAAPGIQSSFRVRYRELPRLQQVRPNREGSRLVEGNCLSPALIRCSLELPGTVNAKTL